MQTNSFTHNAIFQDFFLREKRQVLLAPAQGVVRPANQATLLTALMLDIAQLGFTLDSTVIRVLEAYSADELKAAHQQLVAGLKQMVGASVQYRPLFKRFPEDVPNDVEYLVRRVIGYLQNAFGLTESDVQVLSCGHAVHASLFDVADFGACPICQFHVAELDAAKPNVRPLTETTPLKVLSLATEQDLFSAYRNVVQARTSISEAYKGFAREVISVFPAQAAHTQVTLEFKENLALVAGALLQTGESLPQWLKGQIRTSTDVLRIAAAYMGGDVSLKEACKFKFSNGLRKTLLGLINDLPQSAGQIQADMLGYRNRWLRFAEICHVGEHARRFEKAALCFDVLRNRADSIPTFNSQVASLFEQRALSVGQSSELLALLSQRPGEFARKLDALLQKPGLASNKVLDAFQAVIGAVSNPVLMTLLTHFRQRGEAASFRAYLPKGQTAKLFFQEGDARETLAIELRQKVMGLARAELVKRFAEKAPLGKVYLDDSLQTLLVPFSQRSASSAMLTLPRGSQMPYDASKGFLRLFTHWTESATSGTVDVDLTAAFFDAEWGYRDHVSWTNLSSYGQSVHSGDVRSGRGPTGSAEFIDLDLKAMKAAGIRYVSVLVFSWTGQTFSEFDCFAGFMEREQPKNGDHFEARTVKNKFDVTGSQRVHIPMIVDLETERVVWADLALKSRDAWNAIENNRERVVWMSKAVMAMLETRINLFELFELHVAARGERVETREEAEIVLDADKLFELDDVVANWL